MLLSLPQSLVDFLFPKADSIYDLESMSAGELTSLLQAPRETEEAIAIFSYEDSRVREIIWEIKYRKNRTLAKKMAEILYDVLKQELSERVVMENFINPLLIPLPMSTERRAERGFNQTEMLCEELVAIDTPAIGSAGRENLFEYAPNILIKDRHTESQTKTTSKRERVRNIEHSMRVLNEAEAKGRNIILLDDVSTTGATMREAKRALREAGSKKILSVAIAH
jgi:competence protein ComFC